MTHAHTSHPLDTLSIYFRVSLVVVVISVQTQIELIVIIFVRVPQWQASNPPPSNGLKRRHSTTPQSNSFSLI